MRAPAGAGRRHPRRATPVVLRLRVQLDGAFPPVWHNIEVASDLGLDDLHDVLQVAFGWEDYHLYRFTTGPQDDPSAAFACTADLAQGFDDDGAVPTWDVRLDELLAEVGERLYYQYDYGDDWWLAIEVEHVDDSDVPPGQARLLEGAGAGPPEDCGGIHGYRMIVAAADTTHPDHRQALADVADMWGDEVAQHDLGLVPFDPDAVDAQLEALELAARPAVPRHVGGKLATLLLRARDQVNERQLRRLASSAGGEGILRDEPGKDVAEVHDYLDAGVPMLAAMYRRRLPGYKELGFTPGPSQTVTQRKRVAVAEAQRASHDAVREPTAAQVRAWARAAGHAVSDRGRLSADLWQAYRDAHR